MLAGECPRLCYWPDVLEGLERRLGMARPSGIPGARQLEASFPTGSPL